MNLHFYVGRYYGHGQGRPSSGGPNAILRWMIDQQSALLFVCLLLLSSSRHLSCHALTTLSTTLANESGKKLFFPKRRREGNLSSERWESKFNQLVKFKEKYGHLKVPQSPTKDIPEGYKELGIFCRNIRSMYKYSLDPSTAHLSFLDLERIQRLESIGFVWNYHEANWNHRFEELADFHQRFGHTNVPMKWPDNPELATWVAIQRQRYKEHKMGQSGRFSKHEIRRLDSLGFEWDPRKSRWWKNLDQVKAFHEEHGHFSVPKKYKKNSSLHSYVAYLKLCCKEYVLTYSIRRTCEDIHVTGLDSERLEALRQVNFCWLPDPSKPYQDPPADIFANP